MTAPQLGDWVRIDEAYPETVAKFMKAVERFSDGERSLARDLVKHVGEWGHVWPVLAADALPCLFGVDEPRIYVKWPNGEIEGYYARWLVKFDPPPERQQLGLWLLEHKRPRLADLVRCPVDPVWQRAVAGAWWHQPEARALCEATGHPWLWGGVWECAVTLGLQQPVRAERTAWGLVLSTQAAEGHRVELALCEGAPTTEDCVQHAVDFLRDLMLRPAPEVRS
jgi:hypothetical protein